MHIFVATISTFAEQFCLGWDIKAQRNEHRQSLKKDKRGPNFWETRSSENCAAPVLVVRRGAISIFH